MQIIEDKSFAESQVLINSTKILFLARRQHESLNRSTDEPWAVTITDKQHKSWGIASSRQPLCQVWEMGERGCPENVDKQLPEERKPQLHCVRNTKSDKNNSRIYKNNILHMDVTLTEGGNMVIYTLQKLATWE
jgi:hypothetical protein